MTGVLLALGAAGAARDRAGFKLAADQTPIRLGLPRQQPARRVADIGTIEVETDATNQHLQILLGETGISAGSAGLRTLKAGLDALRQRAEVHLRPAGVGLHHLLNMGHGMAFLSKPAQWCNPLPYYDLLS